jgi:hypothetical protein
MRVFVLVSVNQVAVAVLMRMFVNVRMRVRVLLGEFLFFHRLSPSAKKIQSPA